MPDDVDNLLRRLIDGDAAAAAEILDCAKTTSTPTLLVAAAMITTEPQEPMARAARNAVTTRDRQLVAVAAAHLNHHADLLHVLVREHLSDFPDNTLAAWIATRPANTDPPTPPHR